MLPILIIRNFNPRAPYGARPRKQRLINAFTNFNPRAPYGARPQELFGICLQTNFNPRAPYGARLDPKYIKDMYHAISIHAPHTGRDEAVAGGTLHIGLISIHAPHTGRDTQMVKKKIAPYFHFNPRAPYGARLPSVVPETKHEEFQSTRPIRGATAPGPGRQRTAPISIHAPHTGRDNRRRGPGTYPPRFQSTRPIRGATRAAGQGDGAGAISIHAPHTGRDLQCCLRLSV